jgi:hypothetical protein
MKKYLLQFENPFVIKIFDYKTENEKSLYIQRKIVYVGECLNDNIENGIKELFPDNQFIRKSINVSHLVKFPDYKVIVFNVLNDFTETLFFDHK